MDKDKLNEVAWDYHSDNYFANNPHREDIMDAFKDGAEWLMQQPLADRLTDVEKEKIKGFYNNPSLNKFAREIADGILSVIFGKELFNEK